MFKPTALVAALAMALGSAASANTNLASSVGVEPGVFTTAELIRLQDALQENRKAEVNFILSKAGVASQEVGPVEVFPVADQIRLRRAMEDNNTAEVNFVLSGNQTPTVTQNVQFAESFGLGSDEFSTAELIRLGHALEDNKTSEVNYILSK